MEELKTWLLLLPLYFAMALFFSLIWLIKLIPAIRKFILPRLKS
jgi:hypothetical protein